MNMPHATHRSDWIDAAKGMGIVLVVYGHLLASAYNSGVLIPAHFFELSDSVLYTFHMPLFFFLSGLLVDRSYDKRGPRSFLTDKLQHLAYPYLIWATLQTGIEFILSRHANHPITASDVIQLPIRPHEQFWFLYALLWCYVAYAVFRQLKFGGRWLMAAAAIGLFLVPIPTEICALAEFSVHFLFFVAGIFLGTKLQQLQISRAFAAWIGLAAAAIFLASALFLFQFEIPPTRLIEDYGQHPLALLFLAALGIIAVVNLARASTAGRLGQGMEILGRYSMPIFLAHILVGVFIRMLLSKGLGLENPYLLVIIPILAALIVPIVAYRVSMGLRFPYFFEWKRPQPRLS